MPTAAAAGANRKGSITKRKGSVADEAKTGASKHGGENFEWHMNLQAVYTALQDPKAPDEARKDALLQCWQLAESRNRRVEEKRQMMVAKYGDYPGVPGLIMDLMLRSMVEEIQWRAARALMQLCYSNPDVSWIVMHNAMRETRKREGELQAEIESVRTRIANEDDDVDELKEKLPDMKKQLSDLQARKYGPACLVSMMLPERAGQKNTSARVVECCLHTLNNMANSCWEGHDQLIRDKVHMAAVSTLNDANFKQAYVVSAAAGLVLSLSYKPRTREMLRNTATITALGKVVLLSSTEHNTMSAALALANITGEMHAHECPQVTSAMQVPLKVISALQAGMAREQAGTRYLTVWKVIGCCAALASHERNHLVLAQNGLPTSLIELLALKARNTKTELGCLDVLLRMSFEERTRQTMLDDCPDMIKQLERMCVQGLTHAACKTAEAALWASGQLETPFTGQDGGVAKIRGETVSDTTTNAPGTGAAISSQGDAADVLTIPEDDDQDGGEGGAREVGESGARAMESAEGGLEEQELRGMHVMFSCDPSQIALATAMGVLVQKMTGGDMAIRKGLSFVTSDPAGYGKFESDGVRCASALVILLTKEYQASQFNRAEATAAANLGVPIIVGCSDPHLELAPWVLPMLGEDPFILDLSQVYYDPVAKGLRPANKATMLMKDVCECLALAGVQVDAVVPEARLGTSGTGGGDSLGDTAAPGTPIVFDVLKEDDIYESEERLTLEEVSKWSVMQVGEWISTLMLMPHLRDTFQVNSVDGLLLLELNDVDLEQDLAVSSLKERQAILDAIKAMVRSPTKDFDGY